MAKKAKRSGGILQRFGNWVAGTPAPTENEALIATGGNQISEWPAGFDDTNLDGWKIVGGQTCKTPGEVKAATAKFYGLDI